MEEKRNVEEIKRRSAKKSNYNDLLNNSENLAFLLSLVLILIGIVFLFIFKMKMVAYVLGIIASIFAFYATIKKNGIRRTTLALILGFILIITSSLMEIARIKKIYDIPYNKKYKNKISQLEKEIENINKSVKVK